MNVNGTIGRGAAAVDLNTIPTAIVQSIEVLRDGASAQYGSDAIAGVINVRLRNDSDGGDVTVTYGQRDSDYDTPVSAAPAGATWPAPSAIARSGTDGETLTVSAGKASASATRATSRSPPSTRIRSAPSAAATTSASSIRWSAARSIRAKPTFNRFNAWYGEPELEQHTLFANAGYELGKRRASSTAGRATRTATRGRPASSAARSTTATSSRSIRTASCRSSRPRSTDYSAAGGVDLAAAASGTWTPRCVYGKNEMEFSIENTLNRSIGTASQTEFDAGGFDYDQLVLNFSGVRAVDVGALASPLNVATGVEARREELRDLRGRAELLPQRRRAAAERHTRRRRARRCSRASGRQTKSTRTAPRSAPTSTSKRISRSKFLGSAALRARALLRLRRATSPASSPPRYDFTEAFALRGSVQNGFRAPSLQQQFFATTSTNFIAGMPFDITSFPVTDPVARALGAQAARRRGSRELFARRGHAVRGASR